MKKHKLYAQPEKGYYPGFLIFNNQEKDNKVIGFCPQGWYLECSGFLGYVNSYIFTLDYDNSLRNLRKIEGRGYDFDISKDYGNYEMCLLFEELINLELKHFLEGLEITDQIKQEIYYPEMVRRGYIDILNES
ncbi:MAG: hypothetical protein AAFQ80_12080 [Cyanobacteria bacterium J06621_8]